MAACLLQPALIIRVAATVGLGASMCASSFAGGATGAHLVDDLRTTPQPRGSTPEGFTQIADGSILFRATRSDVGAEIWRFDPGTSQTTLVRDIRAGSAGSGVGGAAGRLTPAAANGLMFFLADDGTRGGDLWRSDGTAAGTDIVVNLTPNLVGGGQGVELLAIGNEVYFTNNSSGLWRTAGAPGDVVQITLPPRAFAGVSGLASAAGRLYFSYGTQATHIELWTVAPGATTATLVADLATTGPGVPSTPTLRHELNGRLIFAGGGPTSAIGVELWSTDGTPEGTFLVRDIAPGPASGVGGGDQGSNFRDRAAVLNGYLYFAAANIDSDVELWRSNGTIEGTERVADIFPGVTGSLPAQFVALADRVLFTARTAATGRELFSSQGAAASTGLVKEFVIGGASSTFATPVVHENLAYFGVQTAPNGNELWSTDGTPAGTAIVADLAPGGGGSSPADLVSTTAGLFFRSTTADESVEPRRYQTSQPGNIELIANLQPDTGSSNATPVRATSAGMFFVARADDENSARLRLTYPLQNNQDAVDTIDFEAPGTSIGLTGGVVLNDRVYFAADGGDGAGTELWRSDGTSLGTNRLTDLSPGSNGSFPGSLTATSLGVVFDATDGAVGRRPYYVPDGGSTPIRLANGVGDISSANGGPNFFELDGLVYFAGAGSPTGDQELWVADGVPANAVEFELLPGNVGGQPSYFTPLGDQVVFQAQHPTLGFEVWSGSRDAGFSVLADILPGAGMCFPGPFHPVGDKLIFSAAGPFGRELYVTNGSTTELLLNIAAEPPGFPGAGLSAASSNPGGFASLADGRVVFTATEVEHGTELWITDGAVVGTTLLKDILPGTFGSAPAGLVSAGGWVYFTAADGVHGSELWRSDGTEAGTRLAADIAPGAWGSVPNTLRVNAAASRLYFSAETPQTGRELWTIAVPTQITGDLNCDGVVSVSDIGPFVLALSNPAQFASDYPNCEFMQADTNADGVVSVGDIAGLVALLVE